MKIWMKNFFYTTIIICLVSTVTLFMLYTLMPSYYEKKLKKEALVKIEEMLKSFEGQPIEETKATIESTFDMKYSFRVVDKNKQTITESLPNTSNFVFFDQEAIEEDKISTIIEQDMSGFSEGIMTEERTFKDNKQQEYTLITDIYSQPISEAKDVLIDLTPYILITSLILGIVVAFVYSKLSTRRILQLSTTTREMLDLSTDTTHQLKGQDEIATLGQDINQLNQTLKLTIDSLQEEVKKVERLEKNKGYFVQSAAHELKTPIAVMSGLVEGMIYDIGKFKDHKTYLIKCQELLQQQTDLINEIASVYQSSKKKHRKKTLENISIELIIREIVTPLELIAESEGKSFSLNLSTQTVLTNPDDLKRLLSNVINNAFRYSQKHSDILIYFKNNQLTVENKCVPLNDDDLENIFEPFYRPDFARNRNDGGTGLGLYFVKQLAETYNYTYSFEPNKYHNGMIFKLEF